jgi:hypothetical protein
MEIIGSSRLGWTGAHDLLLSHELWADQNVPEPLVLADPATGDRREIQTTTAETGVLGALDGRLLRTTGDAAIESTALDGSDPALVADPAPGHELAFFDAIPGALSST